MSRSTLFVCLLVVNFTMAQEWQSVQASVATEQNEGKCIKIHKNKQYFAGAFEGTMNLGFSSVVAYAYEDIFLGKADLNGNAEWLVTIKGNQLERPTAMTFVDDYIFLAGIFGDSLFIGDDTIVNQHQMGTFFAYFDTLGNHLGTVIPDSYNTVVRDMEVDNDGNVLMTGSSYLHFNYGLYTMSQPAGFNFFLLKYNPYFDEFEWGVVATNGSSDGRRVSIGTDNSIYCVGQYNNGTYMIDTTLLTDNVNHNLFTSRFSPDGEQQWVRTVEGVFEVHGYGVSATEDGAIMAGEFEDVVNVDGTIHTSEGFYDVLAVKYDSIGGVLWSKAIGGPESDEGYCVEVDQNGDAVILVEAGQGMNYESQSLYVNGWNEPMLIKLSGENGALSWAESLHSENGSGFVEVADMDMNDDVIAITGINRSAIEFNGNTYSASNSKDFYSAVFIDSLHYSLGLPSVDLLSVEVFPNPVSDVLTIASELEIDRIKLCTLTGSTVRSLKVGSNKTQLQVSNLEPGVYSVLIYTGSGIHSVRLIKQ